MTRPWLSVFNFFVLTLTLFLLSGFQTTFWYQIFGDLPPPMLWLVIVIFTALYRKPTWSLLSIYCFGYFTMSFSGVPLKMIFVTLLTVFMIIYLVKSRIFFQGPGYFTIMVAFGTLCFHITYVIASLWLEKSVTSLLLGTRVMQIILTPLFGYILYFPLAFLDRLTIDHVTRESGGLQG